DSDAYFSSRPRASQLGAWASQQSRPIENRETLVAQYRDMEARHADREIPRPPHWGGYRLVPEQVEFWQGGEHRLHDRFRYQRSGQSWTVSRLQP
ncbi:MAG: pyridoxal 5'-phosphate synthase, partial [Luminiphilus sp.]